MIQHIKEPWKPEEITKVLHPYVKEWFFSKFKEYSLPQLYGVMEVHNKNNVLISAPTGSGKTLTCFMAILNELVILADNNLLENRVYAVYCSPLKALNNDLFRNLTEPLNEIEKIAGRDGKELHIRVAVRTGDTTPNEKQKMLKHPPHILVTTPESLSIVLTSPKFKELLNDAQYGIIDEVHALAENKRGVHLSLSLERLQDLSPKLVRIGLSATCEPLEHIAQYLVGTKRDCKIANVQFLKKFDLQVMSPVPDLVNTTFDKLHNSLYDLLDTLIQEHKTTLVFTNTRAGTERIVHHLKMRFPKKYTENIGAHHGSLSKTHRLELESRLKSGDLKAVVCLDGDTKILLADGTWKKIKDIAEDRVQCIDENLKITKRRNLSRVALTNEGNVIRLRTEFGKKIVATREHKFLTIDAGGNLMWKECEALTVGDFIGTVREYAYEPLDELALNRLVLDAYPNDGFVKLQQEFREFIKCELQTRYGSLREFWRMHIQQLTSYSMLRGSLAERSLFRMDVLRRIVEELKVDQQVFFDAIRTVSSTKYTMAKPLLTKEFMRLLGFMVADGYLSRTCLFVSNRDATVLRYYSQLMTQLAGKAPEYRLSSSGTPVLCWDSCFLSAMLKNLGFKIGRKARILELQKFIFQLPSGIMFSFLSGYFDGDGFSEVKSEDDRLYAAGFCTASERMAQDVHLLLLREGISSSIRERYCDEVQHREGRTIYKHGFFYEVVIHGGDHLRKFAASINPIRENIARIKEVLNLDGYSNIHIIPNVGSRLRTLRENCGISTYFLQKNGGPNPIKYELGTRNIGRTQLGRFTSIYNEKDTLLTQLLHSDITWERVAGKEIAPPPEFVYNIEVEQNHNYIANGFITKNCSTSLELGIDIGYIDLVVCIGSPKSIARVLQRTGRAGHQLHETVKGRIIVMDRDDLVECAVMLKLADERKIDKIHIPENCLDVLAQQLYGMAIQRRWNINELYACVTASYCYRNLTWKDFMDVMSYLSGEFVSLEDRNIYAKVWYDKETGEVGKRGKLSRVIYMTNIGTIPDETSVIVKVKDRSIGSIDEGFLERLKRNDIFVLGGETYQFLFSRGMVAQVVPAHERKPTVPSWFSEMLPLSFDVANEIQRFRRYVLELLVNKKSQAEVIQFIHEYTHADENAAQAVYNYIFEQYCYIGVPHDKKILIENYEDEKGKKYAIFHTLYGRRVNDVLSRAVAYVISKLQHRDVEIGISDNGFYIASQKSMQALRAFEYLKPHELRELMRLAIDKTEVLKRRFRHCAGRALMILREYKGKRKHVGRQQVSSMILLKAVKEINQDFSILKEARREVLEDLMDVTNAEKVLEDVAARKIELKQVTVTIPSPFAFLLATQGYTDILKMEEKIEFIRRMHRNVLAKIGKTDVVQ